jgi:hypothetical protein
MENITVVRYTFSEIKNKSIEITLKKINTVEYGIRRT